MMKLKPFADIIKNGVYNIPALFRALYGLPHSGKYFILSLILIIFFTIVTFPYDYMVRKSLRDMEGRFYKSIDIEFMDVSLFGESYAENIDIILKNNDQLICRKALFDVSFSPFRLYRDNLKMDVQLNSLKFTGKKYSLLLSLNGNIDITVDKKTGLPQVGMMKFISNNIFVQLSDLKIPGPLGPLPVDIKKIEISSINMDSNISMGVLTIGRLQISGEDINGTISGTIEPKSIFPNSKLEMMVRINPDSKILTQYRDLISPMVKDGMLIFYLNGTVGRPNIKLSKNQS